MSQKIVKDVNNIIDNELSEFYFYNKRKREFWHSRSTTISCRVREKNKNGINPMAINIRAFLLKSEKEFMDAVWFTADKLQQEDMDQVKKYIEVKFEKEHSKEYIEKNIGLLVKSLPEEEIRAVLNLENVVSCRLLGYEKEFIYLKCYSMGFLPAFILRTLYHTHYDHSNFIKECEEVPEDPHIGLEFEYYLNKIRFL